MIFTLSSNKKKKTRKTKTTVCSAAAAAIVANMYICIAPYYSMSVCASV